MRIFGFGASFGIAIGVGLGGALASHPASPFVSAIVRPEPRAAPDPAHCSTERDIIEAQNLQIEQLSAEAFGIPIAWPDPHMAVTLEQSIRELAEACADDVEFVDLDCSEPPCLVAFRTQKFLVSNEIRDRCPGWKDAFPRGGHVFRRSTLFSCPGFHETVIFNATPMKVVYDAVRNDPFVGNLSTRRRIRIEDLYQSIDCR